MTGGRRPRALRGALLVLAASFLLPAVGTAQENPLSGLQGPVQGLTTEDLAAALPARAACQQLIRLINQSGAHWQLVREGAMTREQYGDNYNNQLEEWAIHWGSCVGQRKVLPAGLPASVLAWEAALIERLWLSVRAASDAYLNGDEISEINERMSTYRGAVNAWMRSSSESERFWSGQYLEKPRSQDCVSDSETQIRAAGSQLWLLSAKPISEQLPEEMEDIENRLASADTSRQSCDRSGASARAQVLLQGRLVQVYRRGLEGLRNQSDDAVRSAMEEAQRITSRMARCLDEHSGEGPVSKVCNPLARQAGSTEPASESEATESR